MTDPASMDGSIAEHHIELPVAPKAARQGLEGVTETWGGRLDGDHLHLPVVAGLRHGYLKGEVSVQAHAGGSRLTLRVSSRQDRLQRSSVFFLVLGLLGAIAATLWPFSEIARAVAPTGIILAIGTWFLVISRLQNSGPEEFLDAVSTWVESPDDDGP